MRDLSVWIDLCCAFPLARADQAVRATEPVSDTHENRTGASPFEPVLRWKLMPGTTLAGPTFRIRLPTGR